MKIAIYGAGEYGKAFFNALKEKNMEVAYFIDQYTTRKQLMGVQIFNIEHIEDKSIKIYVSVGLNDSGTIPEFLKRNGFRNIISFTESLLEIKTCLYHLMKTNILWMRKNNVEYFDNNAIEKLFLLLSDQRSRDILKNIINFRKTLSFDYYVYPDENIQYFPNDINLFNNIKHLNFVDCGGFIGDTVQETLKYCKNNDIVVNNIISFEADSKNILKLNNEISQQRKNNQNINFTIYPAGVWNQNTILHFSNDGDSASAIVEKSKNTIAIPVFSLDSTISNISINYVKMDIEGAEREAIRGMKNILLEQSPILAICLYHNPRDLWEIPLLINNINPNYNMYIRVYGHLFLETVLYCIPKRD